MQNSKILKIILLIAGFPILIAGVLTTFIPIDFLGNKGIELGDNLSLLNEIRGSGGLMLGTAIIILLGVIHSRMAFTSSVAATVLYLTFGLGRVISILADGIPADAAVKATVMELFIGLIAAFALYKYRDFKN